MIYDTHAHLDLIKKEELPILIENAKKENVKFIISQSVNNNSSIKNLELSKRYPEIIKLSVGLYPEENLKEKDYLVLEKFIFNNLKEVYAIGEIGMDFSKESPNKDLQRLIFIKQLKLAEKLNLPVSIHTRKAEKEVIEVLSEFPKVKKILHCFSGKINLAKKAEEIGCYFSIPANIVRSTHFQKLVSEIKKDRILTETDSPYLSPFPEKQNEPAFIKETIKLISLIWREPIEIVEKQIESNFLKIYKKE